MCVDPRLMNVEQVFSQLFSAIITLNPALSCYITLLLLFNYCFSNFADLLRDHLKVVFVIMKKVWVHP